VVINQDYWGIYQLQRRIDDKFLNLSSTDILLKGYGNRDAVTVQTAYEIVHSPLPEEETYELVQDFFAGTDMDILNLDSFLDVNLFMQWASAADNDYFKNMFYLLREDGSGYRMHMLPWDTDMSWGTVWNDESGGFSYDFEASTQKLTLRKEYDLVKQAHPDLDSQMARRWFELRDNLLTLENMTAVLQQEQAILDASGAQMRDREKWGLFYQGEDSLENLYKSIEARLEWVDGYYSQYLQ